MIYNRIKEIWLGSCIVRLARTIKTAFKQSKFFGQKNYRDLDTVLVYPVGRADKSWGAAVQRSSLLQRFFSAIQSLRGLSVGQVALLSSFVCGGACISLAMQRQWLFAWIGAILGALSLLLVGRREPIMQWLVAARIGGILKISTREWPAVPRGGTIFCLLLGAASALVSIVQGPLMGFAVVAVVAAVILIAAAPSIWFVYPTLLFLPVLGTSICIAMSVVLCISYICNVACGRLSRTGWDYTDSLLACFAALCVIGAVFSVSFSNSLKTISMWLLMLWFPFIMKRVVCRFSEVVTSLRWLLGGALIAAVYGLYQYLSGSVNTTWTDTTLFESLQLRIYSTFANPNVYGEFLLLAAPIAAAMMLYSNRLWKKAGYAAILGLLLVNLALTYSRGCYVGIALSVVVFLWFFSKKLLALAAVAAIPAVIYIMPPNILARIASMVNFSDSSTSYRLKIYIGTIAMLAIFWAGGIGVGEGAYYRIYPFFALQNIVAPHSHSLFFQLVVSFGIGGLAYLFILFHIYYRQMVHAYNALQADDRKKYVVMAFLSMFAGFLLQSVFDYTWYNYRVFMLFWILLILGICTARLIKGERHHD